MTRPSTVGPQPTRGFSVPGGGDRPVHAHRRVHLGRDGIADLVQPGPFHLLERGDVLDAELGDNAFGILPGLLGAGSIAAAARLRRRAMDQSLCRGHPQQRGHLGAAARLAVNHDAVRIAAEIGDVVPNPAKRRHQVGHPDVHRIGIRRPADRGHVEESEDVETVIDRHGHDVVMPGHLRPVLRGEFVGRAEGEAAAMNVEHHRAFAGQAGRPDVHLEHVLALPAVGPLLKERLLARPVMQVLRTIGSIGQGGVLALPRRGRFGRKPPVLAPGVRAIRDAFERQDAILDIAAHLSVLRVRNGRPRRAAASRLLMRSRLGAVGRVSRSGSSRQRPMPAGAGNQHRLASIELVAILGI